MYKKQIMKSAKIFLVDNDLSNLNIYRQGLNDLGYKKLSLFLNGTICLGNLHLKPSMVFLSYKNDDMLNLDILKKIKRYNSDIYVIVISSQENLQIASETLKFGAFDYIIKGDKEIEKMKKVIERIYTIEKSK